MKINHYIWHTTDAETRTRLKSRAQADIASIMERIQPIISDVRFHGDAGLLAYTLKHDNVELQPDQIQASQEDFDEARNLLSTELKNAIQLCAENVQRFHRAQHKRIEWQWMAEIQPGVFAGEKVTPISSVGLYAPGGKNAFPSSVYMLGIPALMAGVPKIALVTPPMMDGRINPATLYAAEISGIKDVYRAGGAQAIAALAYGTESIPKVAKILGPCSPFGAAAKMMLSHLMDPGMPAGPSESIILCDETADPHNTVLDMLNEAEHGSDSSTLLITHHKPLIEYALEHLPDMIKSFPEPQRSYCKKVMAGYGGIIETRDLEESINIVNELATEHLLIKTQTPEDTARKTVNAGEILLGEHTPSTLGNYGIGVNHVLPTGGMAHSYSCTSIWDFLKRTSLAHVTKHGLQQLKDPVVQIADYEGFPAHVNAVSLRNND